MDHPLYRALADHDYVRFATAQLNEREQAGFPPFAYQALLRADAPDMVQSLSFLEQVRGLVVACDGVAIYDPVPMRLARLANRERAQLLIESPNRPALQSFLAALSGKIFSLKTRRDLRWHIDVDPLEF